MAPELANRRVLRSIDSALDDTVPANRSITLRDLLTFRAGFGAVMVPPGQYPIQAAVELAIGPMAKPAGLSPKTGPAVAYGHDLPPFSPAAADWFRPPPIFAHSAE
jgi:hypothetical protein